MNICAIIVAAGNSHRFKNTIPKQFLKYENDLLINQSLKKISSLSSIKRVTLVVNKDAYQKYKNYIFKNKKIKIIYGGKERKDSVYIGLKSINKKKYTHVLIHDGARPFVSIKLIKRIIFNLKKNDAVVPYINPNETIVYNNKIIPRKNILLAQTPQGFKLSKVYYLFRKNIKNTITDEASLFIKNNLPLKKIQGEYSNKKITNPDDILKDSKYGIGYDIHKLEKGYNLYLGGLKIPYKLGTEGHSDGDPVLHALVDSLLGANKLGDIGTLFPNTKKYKKKRSVFFLKEILKILIKNNIKIINIDINIIIQKPNLSKFKILIANNIAKICGLDSSKVSVKAKTTDRVGTIGNEKAVACEVITSVKN